MCLNPSSFEEAIHPDNPLASRWMESMTNELTGKMKNGKKGFAKVVKLAEAAANHRRPMKVKWVFKAKLNIDGSIKELKARLVAKGFVQKKGIDYEATFASTIRAATVRLFFALVAKWDLDLALADVVKAFTQAELDKLIYTEMPQGFEQDGMCLQLFMSLEGMKQSAHLWQKMLADVLVNKLKFERSLVDPCLYTMDDGKEIKIILIVWVDDIAIGHNSIATVRTLMKELNKSINCTFEEKMDSFLGMEIARNRKLRTLTITQKSYITRMFEQHMSAINSKPWKHITPCGTSREDAHRFMCINPTTNTVERDMNIKRGFLSMVGALMFAMCFTRPDVAFHISHLARCMQSPSTEAYEAVLGVMRYLYHTRDLGISFGPIDMNRVNQDTVEYSDPRAWHDASFGTREDGFDPYGGGYIEFYYGPITWQARKLKFIPLSTCEAEVGAMVNLSKEIVFVRNILIDLKVPLVGPSVMVTDSKAANDTVVNAGATKHTVHFERWLHFARNLHMKNVIKSVLTGTDKMRADDKTKVVDKKKFLMCRRETMNLSAEMKDS